MKLKTLFIAIALMAALAGVLAIINKPQDSSPNDKRIGEPLLADTLLEKAAQLRLAENGKKLELAKTADGSWQVTSYHDLPADFDKLARFTAELTTAKVQRLVTTNSDKLARLEFKDTQITLLDASSKQLFSLVLGKTPDTGGGRFIKIDDENKGYLANLNTYLDLEPKSWARSRLLDVSADTINKVEVTFTGETEPLIVSRTKKEEPFAPLQAREGQTFQADKITTILSTLLPVTFTETTATDDAQAKAAQEHARTFKFTTFGGNVYTYVLGRRPEQKITKAPTPKAPGELAAELNKVTGKEETSPVLENITETVPAGPAYIWIADSTETSSVNAIMKKRSFQIGEYVLTGLPQTPDEFFKATPPPTPAPVSQSPTTPAAEGTNSISVTTPPLTVPMETQTTAK